MQPGQKIRFDRGDSGQDLQETENLHSQDLDESALTYRYGNDYNEGKAPAKKHDVEMKLKSKISLLEEDQTRGKSFAKNVKMPDEDNLMVFEQVEEEKEEDDQTSSVIEIDDLSLGLPKAKLGQDMQPSDKKPKFPQEEP